MLKRFTCNGGPFDGKTVACVEDLPDGASVVLTQFADDGSFTQHRYELASATPIGMPVAAELVTTTTAAAPDEVLPAATISLPSREAAAPSPAVRALAPPRSLGYRGEWMAPA